MDIQTPYLDAIQAIPGDTPTEKLKWTAKLIKDRIHECNSLEEVVETDLIPKQLEPLMRVQAALMLNKKDPTNQTTYETITEALKSDDEMLLSKAFEAKSFFDGSNKTITSVQYFFENLFPFVSLNTRARIIKTLAIRLASKNSDLAERFFTAVNMTYGLEQALPLLMACSETFMYNTIVEKRIVLGRRQIKILFRKNPDFVVRYFRLSKPSTDPYQRNLHPVNVYDFGDFLTALIKKRLAAFVELYEMYENIPPKVTLSNKCAESFLKNGKEHLLRNPKLYIKILPLKPISASRMESIFAKLFPENVKEFQTDRMLKYLEYYPQEKRLDFFLKTYQQVYGKNLLDETSNVTPTILKMLPANERVKQARIKLANDTGNVRVDYNYTWTCYLPVEESIPCFKKDITTTPEMEQRAIILCRMIFSCKVNNDEQCLLDVLKYIRDRHKNEQSWLTLKVFDCLLDLYDLPQMSNDHWMVIMEIILRAHVKNDLPAGNSICVKMIEAALHFKIIHEQPIDQLIDILVDMKSMRCTGHWNVLEKYPEYERMCLEACINVVSQRYNSEKTPWKEDKIGILYDVCSSIYRFNEKHVNKNSRIERMSVKSYPWMLEKIQKILSTKDQLHVYIIQNFKSLLWTHEKDLYLCFCPEDTNKIANIDNYDALRLLKRNPGAILSRWKEYLENCQNYCYRESTKRFLRATRWYKDIPVRFVEQCLQDLKAKEGKSLSILVCLLHGKTFEKIVESLMPSSKVIDIHHSEAKISFDMIQYIVASSKLASPPISLQLLAKLFEGEYLHLALSSLINTCRRTSVMDVVSFARTLASQRVSIRKHGIRVIYMVASREQLQQFILAQWKSETNYSVREILFAEAKQLFIDDPCEATWTLLVEIISNLSVQEKSAVPQLMDMMDKVPNEYVASFAILVLRTIDRLAEAGFSEVQIADFTSSLLKGINAAICKLLPEDLIEELLRRFLFYPDLNVSRSASIFVLTAYLLPAKEDVDKRMQMFSNIFVEVVKNGWNVPHPKKPRYFYVNRMVGLFIDELMHLIFYLEMNPSLIDGILKTFVSVLTPHIDATSYLLLIFSKEYLASKTPKEFGNRIGRLMPELIDIFSPVFVFFISSVLQYMLGPCKFKNYDKEDLHLSVVEGLEEIGTTEALLMAVKLLTPVCNEDYLDRYDQLVAKFMKCEHPAIKSVVCDIINKTRYDDRPC